MGVTINHLTMEEDQSKMADGDLNLKGGLNRVEVFSSRSM